MANQLINEQLVEFREIFDSFDEDLDGRLSYVEFRNLMSALGQELTDKELVRLLAFSESPLGIPEMEHDQREIPTTNGAQGPKGAGKGEKTSHKDLKILEINLAYVVINFTEFLTIMSRKVRDTDLDEELIQAFKVFDANEDGQISPGELYEKMIRTGEPLTQGEVQEMVTEADIDGDGQINIDEFVKMMCGKGK